MKNALLTLAALCFVLNGVFAQSRRGQNRYTPPDQNDDDFGESDSPPPPRIPPTRRVPQRRTRPTSTPTHVPEVQLRHLKEEKIDATSLPTYADHLNDPRIAEVRSQHDRYSVPEPQNYPGASLHQSIPDDLLEATTSTPVGPPRKRRPKKRRKQKTNPSDLSDNSQLRPELPSRGETSIASLLDDDTPRSYVLRTPKEPTPSQPDYNTLSRTQSHTNSDHSRHNDNPISAGQPYFQPQSAVNRLPIEESDGPHKAYPVEKDSPQLHKDRDEITGVEYSRGQGPELPVRVYPGDSRYLHRDAPESAGLNLEEHLNDERLSKEQNDEFNPSVYTPPLGHRPQSAVRSTGQRQGADTTRNLNPSSSEVQRDREAKSNSRGSYDRANARQNSRNQDQRDQRTNRRRTPEPSHSQVRLPPTEQPHIASDYILPLGEQGSPDYGSHQQIPDVDFPSPKQIEAEPPKNYPAPSNRLPDPADVQYNPPESSDIQGSRHITNSRLEDTHDEESADHESQGGGNRTPSRSLVSDRLPEDLRSSQRRETAPSDSREQFRRQVDSTQRRSESRVHRGGSRYQPENAEEPHNYDRSSNDELNEDQLRRQVNSNPTRSEPRLQRTGSRYQSDNSEQPSDYQIQSDRRQVGASPQRSEPRGRRTGSRYQPESSEEPRSFSTPSEPQYQDQPRRQINSNPQRSEPQRQRTGSRYQPEDREQPRNYDSTTNDRIQEERVASVRPRSEPRPQRTRTRYQSEIPDETYNHPTPEENQDDAKPRQRPQFDSQPRRRTPDTAPERYPPEYRSVSRGNSPGGHRTNNAADIQPHVADVDSQQRTIQRAPQGTASNRPSRPQGNAPSGRTIQERPSSNSQFRCPQSYGFFADEKQCDKYYECRNGTAEEGLCSDGLVFNFISAPAYLRCDSHRDIDCSARPELQPPRPTKNCPRRFGLFAHETDCTKFWNCVDGVATEIKCPPGLVYHDDKGTCNWADLVQNSCSTEDLIGFTCPEGTPAENQDGVYVRYPHPDNCQLHFTCIKGIDGTRKPRMLSCNEGFVFDPETGQCARPETVPGCEEFYGKPTRAPERPPPSEEPSTNQRSSRRRQRPNQRTRS